MHEDVEPQARLLLPPHIAVHEGPHNADPADLDPAEQEAVSSAIDARRRAFAAGRAYAREGLAQLGHQPVAIPKGPQRSPLWPVGFVGSIAHTRTWAVAAVARSTEARSLGVDVESVSRVTNDIGVRITTDAERHHAADPHLRAVIFSVKEAVYKAQHPLLGLRLGFRAVTLELDVENQTATTVVQDLTLVGRWAISGDLVTSAVLVELA